MDDLVGHIGCENAQAGPKPRAAFPAAGIEFSNATVAVQAIGGAPDAHAGAAASAALAKLQAPAQIE